MGQSRHSGIPKGIWISKCGLKLRLDRYFQRLLSLLHARGGNIFGVILTLNFYRLFPIRVWHYFDTPTAICLLLQLFFYEEICWVFLSPCKFLCALWSRGKYLLNHCNPVNTQLTVYQSEDVAKWSMHVERYTSLNLDRLLPSPSGSTKFSVHTWQPLSKSGCLEILTQFLRLMECLYLVELMTFCV